jgi:hypothetical protein
MDLVVDRSWGCWLESLASRVLSMELGTLGLSQGWLLLLLLQEGEYPWSNATPKTWSLVVASGTAALGWILKRKEARISSRDDMINRCRSWGAIVPVREERHAVVQFFNLLWFMA